MDCQNCKQILPEGSNFCPNCGAKVSKDSKSVGIAVKKQKSNINPVYILIFAGILAILAVVLILVSNSAESHVAHNNDMQQNQNQSVQIMPKIKELEKQLVSDPENIGLNTELGNNYFDLKQYRKALPFYKKVIKSNPKNVEVRIDLAVSFYNLQVVDSALIEINKALELNPHHQQGLYNIGVMYYNTGEKEKAKEYWNKLIRFHEGTQAAETAKQLIQNI